MSINYEIKKSNNPNHHLFPEMLRYLEYLHLKDRSKTARTAGQTLEQFGGWMRTRNYDPLQATTQILQDYQSWLTTTYKTPRGKPLAKTTLCARIAYIKSWYDWLEERSLIISDPAKKLYMKWQPKQNVQKDYLSLQEATALVQTQAEKLEDAKKGTYTWHHALRDLALISLALASGRRIGGLITLKVEHIDLERNEVRVEKEKGRTGRVLPLADWSISILKSYITESRPWFLDAYNPEHTGNVPWLFLNKEADHHITTSALKWILKELVKLTVKANTDLDDLPGKNITWHSLRVTFAKMLFSNGCDIRSVNELMLHTQLSTTARYTPIPVEDLRHVFLTTHPRA